MTQFINGGGVCRTAPGTLGLLIIKTEERRKMCDGRPERGFPGHVGEDTIGVSI